MATLYLVKQRGNVLTPNSDDDVELLEKFKEGGVYRMDLAEMRNGPFFRKWWLLAKIAFDMHADGLPFREYQGRQVLPNFERFRKDLTIMAGFFEPVWNAKGEMRLEAESLKWSKMSEERFEKLYSASIDAILLKILHGHGLTDGQLRAWVDRVLEFA